MRGEEVVSPWRLVGGIMKYYRMSYDEIMYERSYLNLVLLNASIETDGDEIRGKAEGVATAGGVSADDFFMSL